MNLTAILKTITDSARGCMKTATLLAKAHAPEILVGTGVVGFGVTIYETVKATNKAHDILTEAEEASVMAKDFFENREHPEYSKAQYERDLLFSKKMTRRKLFRVYAPVATTGIASVILVLAGYRVLNGRYVATAAAYKLLETGFERYRGNVIDEFGNEVDWRMLNSIKAETMQKALQEREDNKDIALDNRKKLIKKAPKSAFEDIYSRLFDEYSERWKRYWTPEMVLDYLKQKQKEANDKLRINGHLFLNEVYDMLGLKRSAEGQIIGWIYDLGHKNAMVSFGVDEMPPEEIRRILSARDNSEIRVWLHFNTMGVIYNMIDIGEGLRVRNARGLA